MRLREIVNPLGRRRRSWRTSASGVREKRQPPKARWSPSFASAAAGRGDAFLRCRGDDAGQERDVEVSRDEAVADAFDTVVPPGALREQRALCGLDGVETHGRVMPAQVPADAGEKPARALRVRE